MSFLTPWTILAAAGLTVPPLVLMYFLKLKRKEVPISSTFFWKRAVQDLQVNAPFQKLRKNLLMFLQLLVLALAATALGQPLLRQEQALERSLIILIDCSASMNVTEADGKTRLDRAKQEAVKLIEQMRAGTRDEDDEVDRVMVIAFSDRARIVQPFTENRSQLIRAVESIQPTDGLTRLQEAIGLAEAHAQVQVIVSEDTKDTESRTVASSTESKLVLLSDGRIEDTQNVIIKSMDLELVNVGRADDNVGIVSLSASRNYQQPEILNVVTRVRNFGSEPVALDVDLYVDNEHQDVKTVTLAAAGEPDQAGFSPAAAEQVVAFDDLLFERSGIIETRLQRADALPADNRAFAVIPPPKALSVLLVTEGNLWLVRAVQSLPFDITRMTPAEYEAAPEEQITAAGRSQFDAVIFDAYSPQRLPKGNYLFFAAVPPVEGFALGDAHEFDSVFDWNDSHPVMRYVEPSNVDVWSWHELILPDSAVPLMRVGGGVVLAAVNHQGNRYVICAFGLLDDERTASNSTWHLRTHFVVFLTNAIQYLSGNLGLDVVAQMRPGDPIEFTVPAGTEEAHVHRPDGTDHKVLTGGLDRAHYARTDQVGLYTVTPTITGNRRFAVNLFSDAESNIKPNNRLVIGGEAVQAETTVQLNNVPVWPWILIAMLALLLLEWAVYSKRILV